MDKRNEIKNEIKKVMPILPAGKIQGIFKLNKRIGRSLEFFANAKNRDDRFCLTPAAASLQRHSEPQAKNPEKIILDNWILRFAPAPLRMTASVLAFILSLNLSTAWAGEHVCIGSTGKWKDTKESCNTCGSNCNWELVGEGNNKTLNVTGSGTMTDWSSPSSVPWYSEKSNITSANISGVTSVGTNAFSNATHLASVDMPNVEKIRPSAFYEATSLTSVDMPNVTEIGYDAFVNATSLTSAYMPNVEEIGRAAFWRAISLKSVDMPNVTSIGESAFYIAISLSYVGLPTKDSNGCLVDEKGNRLTRGADTCITGVSVGSDAFNRSGRASNCSTSKPSNCGTCGSGEYLVSGLGCVTQTTCGTTSHYYFANNACNRVPDTTDNCETTDYYYSNGAKCVKRESSTSPLSCASGYILSQNQCVANTNASSGTGSGTGTGTGTGSGTDSGTTTAASCTNGASIDGECFPKRYTPAEIAELVGESNTILLYYK